MVSTAPDLTGRVPPRCQNRHSRFSTARPIWALLPLAILSFAGCAGHIPRVTSACNAVPVGLLPASLLCEPRSGLVPIDFRLLGQTPTQTHFIAPGDTLGIYIQGVIEPAAGETAALYTSTVGMKNPYPATGLIRSPIVGVPLQVSEDGLLALPLIEPLLLTGLTLDQAAQAMRRAYAVDREIIQPKRDRILVMLIKPRVHRVLVIRDDVISSGGPSYYNRRNPPYTKRGSSLVVDLPTRENDVLHALMASGGLPGIDAQNEVFVLRSRAIEQLPPTRPETRAPIASDAAHPVTIARTCSRLPLRVRPGQPPGFTPADVILDDGDVVYLKSRDDEVFFTGGLVPGGVFPLPRDRDLTIVEAIAIARGAAGGPAGTDGANRNFRSVGTGGAIDPTRVLIVRQLPGGEQIKIAIDLSSEVSPSGGQLLVQPNDFIMLQFTATELAGNIAMSFLRSLIVYSNNSSQARTSTVTNGGAGGGNAAGGGGGGGGGGEAGATGQNTGGG